jgi:ectoine hydroxylase-related dioxygenase (phytanoyl-CoA dioxygenase family)
MVRVAVEQDGFVVIPGVLDAKETAEILSGLEGASHHRSRAGIRHLLSNSEVAALARDSKLVGIASEVLGGQALPFRATLFDKSPDANWLVVWHQDTALPLRNRKETPGWGPWSVKEGICYAHAPTHALNQVIALRVHFDDSTAQNGPLRVLPGTHKLGVLSDDEVSQVSTERSAVDCLVSRGGVLAMRPLLIHSSSKSQNNLPRRVLHIEYACSMSIGDGFELAVA